jgi:cysteinyl-tRNA synthetase
MIRLYDTAARDKRVFEPADPSRITMYVCGPTVYGRAHIGNARPAVVFDTLARLLRHTYGEDSLIYARNITDVDDKIIEAAAAEGVDPAVITERFERHYLQDMRALGVRDPTIAPHATAEIEPMVAMIATLIERGHAYAAEGHVLFDVASDSDYGALSKRDREAMQAGARVEVAPYKRAPGDFVLWKPSADNVIGWESPWGRGRPGWHIECSAMIRAHLGRTIDIHGGGIDLVFPHHENEAAQSRCAHGRAPLARFWLHNGFVDFGAEKMSKSLGNVVTPEELFAAGHKGEVLRLALLSAHYRSPLPWTDDLIEKSEQRLLQWARRFSDPFDRADWHCDLWGETAPDQQAVDALSDDLNFSEYFRAVHSLADKALHAYDRKAAAKKLGATLALIGIDVAKYWSERFYAVVDEIGDAVIDARVAERTAAKRARDFAAADRIRDELKEEGILLEDGPQGTTWRRA